MRVAIGLALCVLAFPAFAKLKAKPPAPLHDRPSATCRLNFADELRAAREIAQRDKFEAYPIEGADVAKFLAIFNAAEPKTDFKAEQIVVSANPKFAYIEMFEAGCMSHSGKLGPRDFEALMTRAYGDEPAPGAMRM